MRWPRISIVTPSYNQGKFIGRTVRSVLLQRYPNLDYILMDGGSTDDTVSNLAPYKEQFSFFVSEPDNGQADAIAKGFARSSGDIMAYLNSDDLLAPDALHFVATYFQNHPDVDCIYSHRCTVDENDRVLWYWILPPHCDSWMKRWDFIPQETCFWRRSLFEKAGNVDPIYHFTMDYDLFVRFMNLGRVRRVNRFLGAFRQHSESKTTQLLGILGRREMLKVRQKYRIARIPRDGLFGMLLGQWVSQSGHRFAWSNRILPGALPGDGYDYNDFWGGALRRSGLECEKEQNLSNNSKKLSYDPTCPITQRFPDLLLFSITSTGTDRVQTNDIYINLIPRTAIILPSLEGHWRQLKSKISADEAKGAQLANGNHPDLLRDTTPETCTMIENTSQADLHADRLSSGEEDQTADMIVGLTRGCLSENGEVAFLDVGCNTGELLGALKARTKWKLFGLEANPSAATEAISKGHRVFEASLERAPDLLQINRCFDLVFLGHRLEGFAEPRMSLRSLALLLNPGGFLILSTPNLDSEQLKLHGPAWAHWKPEEQRFIYSKKSLKLILSLAGFNVEKLSTVSWPDSTVLRLKRFSDSAMIANSADHANMKSTRQMELIAGKRLMVADRHGKGDVIFAICKRLF